MRDPVVPKENLEIYRYLYAIETGLRELIIATLEPMLGPKWYQSRLPGDVLGKYREGRTIEALVKWTDIVPLHPLYYVDFPDLRKIITRVDNWRDGFKPIFQKEDLIKTTLAELDVIRNKIAHNRKATNSDLEIVKTAHSKLSKQVGAERFKNLSNACTSAPEIKASLARLRDLADRSYRHCTKFEAITDLKLWGWISAAWWFDESYLGQSLKAIREFFGTVEGYAKLPRRRGSGHIIESWVASQQVPAKFRAVEIEFAGLLD